MDICSIIYNSFPTIGCFQKVCYKKRSIRMQFMTVLLTQ